MRNPQTAQQTSSVTFKKILKTLTESWANCIEDLTSFKKNKGWGKTMENLENPQKRMTCRGKK